MSKTQEKECRSCLLISMPQLLDPNFFHTTSLLSEFTSEGAMGVVLNRPLDITLDQLLSKDKKITEKSTIYAYWGGPVQNERGFIVHEDESFATEGLTIAPGLYLSGSSETLEKLVTAPTANSKKRFRLFLGYAGWGPGQLEREIAESSWITAPIDHDLIFASSHENLWEKSMAKLGIDPSKLAASPQTQAH